MNEPHFEVFPETRTVEEHAQPPHKVATGQFVWHFKAADGRITHVGGEGFARREDAHRSIENVAMEYCRQISLTGVSVGTKTVIDQLPIVDLDADGQVI